MKYIRIKIRIIWLVASSLLLLFLPSQVQCQSEYQDKGQGYAQTKAALPSHCQQVFRQQIIQEFITLILKGDICALLNRCEVPPLSKAQERSFFSIFPPGGQTEGIHSDPSGKNRNRRQG